MTEVLPDQGHRTLQGSGRRPGNQVPRNDRVVKVKPDGTQTTVGSGLKTPIGVAVDGTGAIFVADTGNNRVVKVTSGVRVTVSPVTPTVQVLDAGGTYNQLPFAATAT